MVIRPATALNDTNKPQKSKKTPSFQSAPFGKLFAAHNSYAEFTAPNRSKILIFKIEFIHKSG
ncbi:TPA: hypothetical protein ACWZKU_001371 [Klebsiella variicola]